jgi:hypothetical protein
MQIAHLILAHKNPKQLLRLIQALRHPAFHFYIHLDSKTDMEHFACLAKEPDVYFISNRANVNWAGYGMVQAAVNGLEQILSAKKYDYINVLSAQDLPLKSPDDIYGFLKANKGKEFITSQCLDTEWTEAKVRIEKYHFVNWTIPGKFRLEKLASSILPKRKFPLDYKIVGRSQWFTITAGAANYILLFLQDNPKVIRFFKYTWAADELIFATILYNSDFKKNIADNLMYVDWEGCTTGHPRVLTIHDYEKLHASGKMFARKFDPDVDEEIIRALESDIKTIRETAGVSK